MLDQSLELGKKMLIEKTLKEIDTDRFNIFHSKLLGVVDSPLTLLNAKAF